MAYYAGLDVSLEETAVCVVDAAGKLVKEARVSSEPEALVGFFGKLGLPMDRIGLEACSMTAWLSKDESAGAATNWPEPLFTRRPTPCSSVAANGRLCAPGA